MRLVLAVVPLSIVIGSSTVVELLNGELEIVVGAASLTFMLLFRIGVAPTLLLSSPRFIVVIPSLFRLSSVSMRHCLSLFDWAETFFCFASVKQQNQRMKKRKQVLKSIVANAAESSIISFALLSFKGIFINY